MRYGSLFDATQTMVAKIDDDTYQVQVVSWYDNENSYTSQMVRTIKSVSYTHLDVYKRQGAGERRCLLAEHAGQPDPLWRTAGGQLHLHGAEDVYKRQVTSLLSGAIVGGVGSMFSIRKHLNV